MKVTQYRRVLRLQAAHPHPAGAEAIRPRRDAVQSLPSDLLTNLLRKAITKRLSGVGRKSHLLRSDYTDFYFDE